MKSTLIGLWNGDIRPCEEKTGICDSERKLVEYIARHRKDVIAQLDDKGKESLEKLIDCSDELWSKACDDAFAKGFSLAIKIMVESLA